MLAILFLTLQQNQKYKEQTYKILFGKLTYSATECECCGTKDSVVKNRTRTCTIKIPRISEYPCLLQLKKQRFKCKECNQTFVAETHIVDEYCNISSNVINAVMIKATEIRSIKSIASDCCISSPTVNRIIRKATESIRQKAGSSLPEHIMMDEFKSVKHVDSAMSFIYCDSLTHQIVHIVEDRKKQNLRTYFERFELSDREKVKIVCIDMYEPYMSLIKDVFPKADIVVDKFYIVQAINRELNRCRVQTMNRFKNKDKPMYNKFKKYWKLMLKPQGKLNYTHYHYFKLYCKKNYVIYN
ncbi:ISL3 family transposase [Staphylococcus aureus]|uniref:ISL3 family transposase n=1 Tax=Staphylococcus aureus TaxID=1280 RepID=UPI0032FC17DC|nr:ISL3 family transposase [Staphylococcus aureus]